jgi:hypothetical protein
VLERLGAADLLLPWLLVGAAGSGLPRIEAGTALNIPVLKVS